jgi:hypothetical protein
MSGKKELECSSPQKRKVYSILNTLLMAVATLFPETFLNTTFSFAFCGVAGEGPSQLKPMNGSTTVPAAFYHIPLLPKV